MNVKQTLRNLIVVNFACFLTFAAYLGLFNLQSTINAENQIGVSTLVLIHAVFTIASIVLPNVCIKKLGCKVTLFVGILGYLPYVVANLYPIWITFIPSAVLCGLGAALYWTARASYLNGISSAYSSLASYPEEAIRATFFGISSISFGAAQVFGSAISYGILKPYEYNASKLSNISCGAKFCDNDISRSMNPNLEPPSDEKRYLLTGCYTVFLAIAGLMVLFGLDSMPLSTKIQEDSKNSSVFSLILEAFLLLRNPKQLLLLPLAFHAGFTDGFIIADFSKAYIGCALGIHHVGMIMIAYGVACSLTSAAFLCCRALVKHCGLSLIFISAALCSFITYITLLILIPSWDNFVPLLLLSAAWGYSDAIWWSQIIALYGILFKESETSAFANFYIWSSIGLLVAYAVEEILCTKVKIFVLISILLLGMLGYCVVEIWTRKEAWNEDSQKRKCSVQDQSSP